MSTTECFLQETLLLFLNVLYQNIFVSQCNAAFCFLSLDLNELIAQLLYEDYRLLGSLYILLER